MYNTAMKRAMGMARDMWDIYRDYAIDFEKYTTDLDSCDLRAKLERLRSSYSLMKRASVDLFEEDSLRMHDSYEFLLEKLYKLEKSLTDNDIIDTRTGFNPNGIPYRPLSRDCYEIVDWIVKMTRQDLNFNVSKLSGDGDYDKYDSLDLANYCSYASRKVELYSGLEEVENYSIVLIPGFNEDYRLFLGSEYHAINILYIDGKYFLVDPTYKQFFSYRDNLLERTGIMGVSNCNLGRYVLMDDLRKQVAMKLLKDGWIELTPEIFKAYLDGFAIKNRNQLYYDITGDYSYTTPYSVEDYISFLNGEDDQVKHEGREVLGLLKRPIIRK